MDDNIEQFFATIIEQCLSEHRMQPPFVIRTVGENGSLIVANVSEDKKLAVSTKHCENDSFTLPIRITIMGQNNNIARLVIDCDGLVSPIH